MSLRSVLANFAARTQSQIRDGALTILRAGYTLLGRDLDIQEGSDAWMVWSTVGLLLEAQQQQAAINSAQCFPDTADTDNLEHHARVEQIDRKPTTDATLTIQITGTAGSSWTDGQNLTTKDGIVWSVSGSGTLPGGGSSTATVLTKEMFVNSVPTGLGIKTNKAVGTVLTWQAPSSGIDATATVTAIATLGTDRETDRSLAERVLARRREKPSGFNRAEIRAFLEAQTVVDEAYVLPCYEGVAVAATHVLDVASSTDETAGKITALILGASPNRILSDADVSAVEFALQQLTPAGIFSSNVVVLTPATTTQNVLCVLTLSSEYAFPFTGTLTVDTSGSDVDTVVCTTDPTSTVAVGDLIAVKTNAVRGNLEVRKVATVTASPNKITVTPSLGDVPVASSTVYPAPANWESARDAVLAIFDALGPGSPPGPNSVRYPEASERGSTTLFVSRITAALVRGVGPDGEDVGVDGITAVSVTTPAADVAETEGQLLLPGDLIFTA